jgi:hypothetical protein
LVGSNKHDCAENEFKASQNALIKVAKKVQVFVYLSGDLLGEVDENRVNRVGDNSDQQAADSSEYDDDLRHVSKDSQDHTILVHRETNVQYVSYQRQHQQHLGVVDEPEVGEDERVDDELNEVEKEKDLVQHDDVVDD